MDNGWVGDQVGVVVGIAVRGGVSGGRGLALTVSGKKTAGVTVTVIARGASWGVGSIAPQPASRVRPVTRGATI